MLFVYLRMLLPAVVLIIVPVIAGSIFVKEQKGFSGLLFQWVSGQMLLWAGFQVLCVPLILTHVPFSDFVAYYSLYAGFIVLLALFVGMHRFSRIKYEPTPLKRKKLNDKRVMFLWVVFALLLIVQLVLTLFMAYEEGDDAFYIGTATITVDADTMYCKLPYTGGETLLDARHGLAPFPIWLAYLAKISCIHPVIVGQVLVPPVLILMAYAIFYLLGEKLIEDKTKNLPLFMILISLLVMWGGYSLYTAENFLLVRTTQGKAVLADIVLPFLFLMLLQLLERMQRGERAGFNTVVLLGLTMVSGTLCSTLGSVLTCMLLGITGLLAAISYRKWSLLPVLAACCVIPAALAVLYFVLG